MTLDEYLLAVARLVGATDRNCTGVKASTLGNLILRSLPERWNAFGYQALKDLLNDMARRGQLIVNQDSQGIIVVKLASPVAEPPNGAANSANKIFRLRSEVWRAFVDPSPPGKRFLQRSTGAVLLGQSRPPQGEGDWIEIPPVTQETQKQWARDLIVDKHLEGAQDLLHDINWYTRFAQYLRDRSPTLLLSWNRSRSSKVTTTALSWCEQNGVPHSVVTGGIHTTQSGSQERGRPHVALSSDAEVRRHIFRALERMPTDELLEIPIQGKYLFARTVKFDI